MQSTESWEKNDSIWLHVFITDHYSFKYQLYTPRTKEYNYRQDIMKNNTMVIN